MLEAAWQSAREGVRPTAAELARVAEGTGLVETAQDLRDARKPAPQPGPSR